MIRQPRPSTTVNPNTNPIQQTEEAAMPTTLLRKREGMPRQPLPECHGGVGDLDWTDMLAGVALETSKVQFIHDDILRPGVSIGVHPHDTKEEYYIILEGKGIMTLDGTAHEVGPGDVTAIFPGGRHGLVNTGEVDMRVIVVGLKP